MDQPLARQRLPDGGGRRLTPTSSLAGFASAGSSKIQGGSLSATSRSEESERVLARFYGTSPTTVQRWQQRTSVADQPMNLTQPKSTMLSLENDQVERMRRTIKDATIKRY